MKKCDEVENNPRVMAVRVSAARREVLTTSRNRDVKIIIRMKGERKLRINTLVGASPPLPSGSLLPPLARTPSPPLWPEERSNQSADVQAGAG